MDDRLNLVIEDYVSDNGYDPTAIGIDILKDLGYRVEISWGPFGNFDVSVYDKEGNELFRG